MGAGEKYSISLDPSFSAKIARERNSNSGKGHRLKDDSRSNYSVVTFWAKNCTKSDPFRSTGRKAKKYRSHLFGWLSLFLAWSCRRNFGIVVFEILLNHCSVVVWTWIVFQTVTSILQLRMYVTRRCASRLRSIKQVDRRKYSEVKMAKGDWGKLTDI